MSAKKSKSGNKCNTDAKEKNRTERKRKRHEKLLAFFAKRRTNKAGSSSKFDISSLKKWEYRRTHKVKKDIPPKRQKVKTEE